MNIVKRIYTKARREYLQKLNNLRLKRANIDTHVALVSCDKWANRVYDDLLLQKAFLDSGIAVEIVSWQNKQLDFAKYDALLITSMWGYQNFVHDFEQWLKKVEDLKVFNSVKIIRDNYDKVKQIAILKKNHLPIVPTKIIKKSLLKSSEELLNLKDNFDFPMVIKPSVSGSGENTFMVKDSNDLNNILGKLQEINKDKDILAQSFLPEIDNGEISVIVINKKIVNAVVRFPGVIGNSNKFMVKPLGVTNLDADLLKICDKVIGLEEYCDELYMRIDVVKKDNSYIIMEIELFEPQLFYYLLKGSARKTMLKTMVNALKERL